jgi:hypothetical protein
VRRRADEHVEEAGNAEQAESDHQQSGDGAAAEGHRQGFVEAAGCRLRGAHVGAHRDVHADEAGRTRQDGADREADGRRPAEARHEGDDEEDHDADDGDRAVLPVQVGLGPLLDRRGNGLHAGVAGIEAEDPLARIEAIQYGA